MMPGRDGYTVLRDLRLNPATAEVPVVLLSAKATDAEVWEGWKAGADYYITKPFDPSELTSFIDHLMTDPPPKPPRFPSGPRREHEDATPFRLLPSRALRAPRRARPPGSPPRSSRSSRSRARRP